MQQESSARDVNIDTNDLWQVKPVKEKSKKQEAKKGAKSQTGDEAKKPDPPIGAQVSISDEDTATVRIRQENTDRLHRALGAEYMRFRKIESPVLGDLEIHWNDEVEMWPERVPDLYAGEPVLVAARLQRFVGEVRLSGRRGERPFEVSLPLTPDARESGIHKLWARRKIAHWMAQGTAGMPAEQVREEVLAVALDHELVSKFTSLVAVDVTPRRPIDALLASANVPNHGPAGFDPRGVPGVLLPQGATPAPLLVWLGCGLLLLAGILSGQGWRRS